MMQIDGRMQFGKWKHVGNGVFEKLVDGEGTTWHTQRTQDAQPIIDHNTRVRNETNGFLPDRSARKVGAVPVTLAHQWMREWIDEGRLVPNVPGFSRAFNDLLLQRLKDRDYAKLRTTENI